MLALLAACSPKSPAPVPPPPKVEVLVVQPQRVEIFDEIIATLDGSSNTNVRSQVTGYLLRQHYKNGSAVEKGQLLFEIDPQPFPTPSSRLRPMWKTLSLNKSAPNGKNSATVN